MKKLLIAIIIILFVVLGYIGIRWLVAYINDNTEPIIYYSFNDNPNLPLDEESSIFSNNLTIVWTNNCIGTIKKDEEIISKKNGTLLLNEGTYEITVKSPSGKNKITRILRMDKTPPKVELKKTLLGTYNIVFEEPNDVAEAILLRYDVETNELISRVDLVEDGKKEKIEIKEKGYYVFNVADQYGNSTNSIEFSIE